MPPRQAYQSISIRQIGIISPVTIQKGMCQLICILILQDRRHQHPVGQVIAVMVISRAKAEGTQATKFGPAFKFPIEKIITEIKTSFSKGGTATGCHDPAQVHGPMQDGTS